MPVLDPNIHYSIDIERAVLGAMFFEQEAVDIAMGLIVEEVFYSTPYAFIFRAMSDLFKQGAPIDHITVTNLINTRGQMDAVGGEEEIMATQGQITGAANIAYHCRLLLDKLALRKLKIIAASLNAMCDDRNADPYKISGEVEVSLTTIQDIANTRPYRGMDTVIQEAFNHLKDKSEALNITGIPTGITSLDRFTDGWQPSDLVVIAAKTSQGKTALALNSARCAAEHGFPVGIFSMEMNDVRMGVRLLSSKSRVDLKNVRYCKPTNDEWSILSDNASSLSRAPLYINDTPGLTISQIAAISRRMQREVGVKLIIVDYIQLAEGENKENRQMEVTSISRGLKRLAMALHIPVIALSQFNRKADESDTRQPRLSDLRESGAIEQDADMVLFIHNASDKEKMEYPCMGEGKNIRELIIPKNRNGETGNILVVWKPEHVSFYDVAY